MVERDGPVHARAAARPWRDTGFWPCFYAFLTVAVIVLSAAGRLSSTVGTYAQAVEGNPFPAHFIPSLAEHVSAIALALAVLPFVVGAAWLVAGLVGESSRERRAFAAVGTLTIAVLAIEVTSFDLRFGGGVVRERYFFYVVPIVLAAFAGALCDTRWPRWSLLVPLPVILYGFWHSGLPQYPKLNIDTPVSILHDELLDARAHTPSGARHATGRDDSAHGVVRRGIDLRQACVRGRCPRADCRRRATARDAVRLPASVCRRRDGRQTTHPRPRSGVRLRRPHRRAERSSDDGPVPGALRGLLGRRRLLVGHGVLEQVRRASRALARDVRVDSEHVPQTQASLRPQDGRRQPAPRLRM